MGMSNTDKQRRYRERALKDPDGLLLTRLQVMLSRLPTQRSSASASAPARRSARSWRPLSCTSMVTL